MKNKVLLPVWAGLFSLCAGLGFIPEPAGLLKAGMTLLSVLFFVPPMLILYQANKGKDWSSICLIRNLSALSLILTLVLLIGNFLSAMAPEIWGTVLYCLLIIITSPMVCSGYWALSLFLWACLLMTSLRLLKTK